MKKHLFLLAIFMSACTLVRAQEESEAPEKKTGWNFGGVPAISYDSDLGFQYGLLVNFFDYGDGSRHPGYDHSLYFEVSRFTKGSGIYRFSYDSEALIPGIQVTADVTYFPNKAYDFLGFNGYEAVMNTEWEDDSDPNYRTRMFYKQESNMFRAKADFQIPLGESNFKSIVGFNMLNFDVDLVDIDNLNENREETDADWLPSHDEEQGLYEFYRENNLISAEESDGGFLPLFKAGVVFDSRDNRANTMSGMWTEVVLVGTHDGIGSESSFLKLNATHRQYFTLIKRDLSFAYRLSYQTTVAGHTPFYYQNQVITSILKGANSIGLGGSASLRGVRMNRVVGDGFFYGNAELRWKAWHFNLINQKFYLGINGFLDFGRVVQYIDIEDQVNALDDSVYGAEYDKADYFNFGSEKMHMSYGLGIRLAMNENFIIALDHGRVIKTQDGSSGTYIGLNYLF